MHTIKKQALGVLAGLTLLLNAGQAMSATTYATAEIDWSTFTINSYGLGAAEAPGYYLSGSSSNANSSVSDWLSWSADTANNASSFFASTSGNDWGNGSAQASRSAEIHVDGSGFLTISANYSITAGISSISTCDFDCFTPNAANASASFSLTNNSSSGTHSSQIQKNINLGGYWWENNNFGLTSAEQSGILTVGVLVNSGDILNFSSSVSVFARDVGYFSKADVAPVPVPAAVWLFSAGLMGMLGIGRRKTAAHS